MLCGKCHNGIPDDSVYCCYCGKKQIREKTNAKRANGLGSVYYDDKRKVWIAQIVTGRHYTKDMKIRFSYKRPSFKTRTDALKAVQTYNDEIKKRPDFTLSYYYNSFMQGRGAKLSYDKKLAYRKAFERLKPLSGKLIKELTLPEMQAVIDGSCVSYYPAKDIRTLLNAVFKMAVAHDRQINATLPQMLDLPPMEETEVEPFTEEEQLQLWYSYESGNTNAAIPLIMIYTGMMTGELRKLTKEMISLEDKLIDKDIGLKTKERKKRVVLLPDDIIPVLEDIIKNSTKDKLFPMGEQKFYDTYYDALSAAGITRHLTPYSCRHTTATVLAVHENVAPQTLQRVMRWKSTKMMDRYVTPTDTDARKAVNRI